MRRLSSTMLCLTVFFCVLVAAPIAMEVADGCDGEGKPVSDSINPMCGTDAGGGDRNTEDTESLISVDVGVLHMKSGTVPGPNGGKTTVVEAGFRTGVWNQSMTVEDTLNLDGSRDVTTTHERSIGGGVTHTTGEHIHISADDNK